MFRLPPQAGLVADRNVLGEVEEIEIDGELLHKANAARKLANKALHALSVQDSGRCSAS